MRAILSVYDKTNLEPFARGLVDLNFDRVEPARVLVGLLVRRLQQSLKSTVGVDGGDVPRDQLRLGSLSCLD